MDNNHLISASTASLLERKAALEEAIATWEAKLHRFESYLRAELSELIIEERELFARYKAFKKEKKEKRRAQQRKGKKGVIKISLPGNITNSKSIEAKSVPQHNKKRLYRETMLLIHPDKFSTNDTESEQATQLTQELIRLYQEEDATAFYDFCSAIKGGGGKPAMVERASSNLLQHQLEELEKRWEELQEKPLVQLIKNGKQPAVFAEELREYYLDRIQKFKKRTRKYKGILPGDAQI